MSDNINGHNHREVCNKQMMNCALCGKEIEKHCSLVCQECWDKKHSALHNSKSVVEKK